MSDLEEELLGLAEDDPHRRRKKSKSKSKAFIDDSEEEGEEEMDMDMDMDIDNSDDDGLSVPAPKVNRNPYPLEGKYIDEDDRERRLENMPEIERESILAAREDEMQKFRDSQQLDMMFRMAGADDDDDDDEHARKRRKHTSVTKEASRAIKDLKSKRKAHDERAQRRALRREKRARSRSPGTDSQTEDGEIPKYDTHRRSPLLSPSRKTPKEKREDDKEDLDSRTATVADVNGARVSRYEIVDMMFKEGFEDVLVGSYVRLMAKDLDAQGRPKYRINRIVEMQDHTDKMGLYSIEYKGRNVSDGRALLCQYGKASRIYRIADVSNGDFEQSEFDRLVMTNQVDGVKMPKRSDLQKKHEAIKRLRDRPMTDEEINRQVEARRSANPGAQRSKTLITISQLVASRSLALRRNDTATVNQLEAEIIELGGDPTTGQLVESPPAGAPKTEKEDYDAKIQRINEHRAKKNKESMAAAHIASMKRKKAEEAIVRARTAGSNSPAPVVVPKPVPLPASGLKKGETPQQYVARTIDLDLGDF